MLSVTCPLAGKSTDIALTIRARSYSIGASPAICQAHTQVSATQSAPMPDLAPVR